MTLEAVKQAVSSPLLETSIEGATGVLINVKGGMDLPIDAVNEAADLVRQAVDPNCNIIFGAGIDENLQDEVEITIIATGFEPKPEGENASLFEYHKFPSFEDDEQTETQREPEPAEPEEEEEVEEEKIPTSRVKVEIDDDIPPFLRKIRGDN